jgi:hypothetical protein
MDESSTLGLSKLITLGPVISIRCSQYLDDLIHLIDLIGPWKQGAEGIKFCHDASESEDIHG